ncbi:hypothetical protein [Mycolicibacterium komossense]|uniref:Uncharacterized protein n=1 Tax=Mycolicibacterium komossense TaxID=1779 RepID=A0ABT3C7A9_9MYCO|nr:hypothetical protein [Mycolicibacterium komossense]MCV7225336.1 hypothetical protein [Mycolicibacterium komossense]
MGSYDRRPASSVHRTAALQRKNVGAGSFHRFESAWQSVTSTPAEDTVALPSTTTAR